MIWLEVFGPLAVVVAFCGWLGYRLTRSEGQHAGRGEETLFAGWDRPAEIATEPAPELPEEMLSAPVAAPPEVSHDEYAPQQSYDGHAESSGGFLLLWPAVALAAVTAMRGLLGHAAAEARHLKEENLQLRDDVQQLRDERDFPELLRPWADDTGSFTLKDLELVRAAEAQDGTGNGA